MTAVSIILPCYNPPSGWPQIIADSFRGLEREYPNHLFSLVLVNDGSSQNFSAEQAAWLKQEIVRTTIIPIIKNTGKGFALRTGVQEATGDIFIYTDIDFPYTPESVRKILNELLADNCDIAAGVRGKRYYENVPRLRMQVSKILRRLIRILLRIRITDTQCGLKGFNCKGREIFLATHIHRYLFDLEFIMLASKRKEIRLKAIEVELKPGILFRKLNFTILLHESFNLLKIFFRTL